MAIIAAPENTPFDVQMSYAKATRDVDLRDISNLFKALSFSLGRAWEKPLGRYETELSIYRDFPAHPFFWSEDDCKRALTLLQQDMMPATIPDDAPQWTLSALNATLYIIPGQNSATLWFQRQGARIAIAHYGARKEWNDNVVYATHVFERTAQWFSEQYPGSRHRVSIFSPASTTAKKEESAMKRLKKVASELADACNKE